MHQGNSVKLWILSAHSIWPESTFVTNMRRQTAHMLCIVGSFELLKPFKKVKVCFYIAQYPVRWTTQTALHFSHGRPVQFRHQLDFSGKHPSHAAITHEDYPFTFPPLSIARYLFIQSLGRRGQNENGHFCIIKTRILVHMGLCC